MTDDLLTQLSLLVPRHGSSAENSPLLVMLGAPAIYLFIRRALNPPAYIRTTPSTVSQFYVKYRPLHLYRQPLCELHSLADVAIKVPHWRLQTGSCLVRLQGLSATAEVASLSPPTPAAGRLRPFTLSTRPPIGLHTLD